MDKFLVDYMGTRFELYGAAAKAMQALVDECAELRAENERLRRQIEDEQDITCHWDASREVE